MEEYQWIMKIHLQHYKISTSWDSYLENKFYAHILYSSSKGIIYA